MITAPFRVVMMDDERGRRRRRVRRHTTLSTATAACRTTAWWNHIALTYRFLDHHNTMVMGQESRSIRSDSMQMTNDSRTTVHWGSFR